MTEITEVLPAPPSDALAGFGLDTPQAGLAGNTYAFDLRGWAVGARSPAAAVRLLRDGDLIRRLPVELERPDVAGAHPGLAGAERSGFFGTFSALALERSFELQLELRLEDKTRLPLALVRGTRAPIVSPFRPRLQPVVLTTLGRTGSTAVVRMLAAHQEIVAYRPFEYEPRVATYWMDVFRALSDPAGYRRQLTPTGTINGTWWLGHQAPLPRRIHDPSLDPWLEATAIGELAAVAQQRIERLYAEVAAAQGRPDASHFVEKYRADTVPELMLELYPGAREVMLVRDFRDMIASMFAYNEKRGRQGFRRDRATSDHDYVVNDVGASVAAMADAWRRRSSRAQLLRYEDLVLRPEETVESLLGHLGLDAGPAAVEPMVASLLGRDSDSEGHRTVSDPRESIGRWRRDLSDEVAAACAEALGPSLEIFGYEPA
ncbi:MAG: sulfotransferase family protein [Solirubrobacterales bacterium]